MTACHLIAHRNLSLLSDVAAYYLIYTGGQLIAVFTGKYFNIYYNTIFAVGNAE